MLFNSIQFAIFLPILFILYWLCKSVTYKNITLLSASYFFYACWDWRFLFLLLFSTVLDFYSGNKISNTANNRKKKFWLTASIMINLCILSFFKYYNFFVQSFQEVIATLGLHINPWTLEIILPVGISFYTFHGISYVIDIYKKSIQPEKKFINYALFVSFFPLLVAGPIERAKHLLPQIHKNRCFDYEKATDGLRQILWGLFKKIVIADQCSVYSDMIFNEPEKYSASTLLLGAVFFTFQIYADFSGYSDIAIGTARLFNIDLMRNFNFPYFSKSISEFWTRWHISLSTWFRDYIYIPLGGNKINTLTTIRNIFILFLLSGLWHGANWTFIIWGLLHAIYILPSIVFNTYTAQTTVIAKSKNLPSIKECIQMSITFGLVVFAWIFFRAENMTHAFTFIAGMYAPSILSIPSILPKMLFLFIIMFVFIEWIGKEKEYALAKGNSKIPRFIRWIFYYIIIFLILHFAGPKQQFIYFQF